MIEQKYQSDCDNCLALCCVAPPFAQSDEFAFSKGEGEPCSNMNSEYSCSIHEVLIEKGFSGCVKFECFGAGQKVTNHHFKGRSWRDSHLTAKEIFHVFFIVKSLHQFLVTLMQAQENGRDVNDLITDLEKKSDCDESELLTLDLGEIERQIKSCLESEASQVAI